MSIASLTHIGSVPLLENGTNNPLFLSKIYQLCRKFNTEFGLSGVMSYARGLYILTIEGSKEATKAFLYNEIIQELTDEYVIISEKDASQATLSKSPLRISRSVANDPEYLNFLRSHIPAFDELEENTQKLIEQFLPKSLLEQPAQATSQLQETSPINAPAQPKTITTKAVSIAKNPVKEGQLRQVKLNTAATAPAKISEDPSPTDFSNYKLKLKAWPDFRKIKQDPFTIELCARLTAAAHSYSDLSAGIQLGNKEALDELLAQLHGFGILQLTAVKSTPVAPAPAKPIYQTPQKKKSSFYGKMKKLLGFNA